MIIIILQEDPINHLQAELESEGAGLDAEYAKILTDLRVDSLE